MSENRRRTINDRPQRKIQSSQTSRRQTTSRKPQPTTSQRQQPQRNIQRSIGKAQSRIQNIKSPFASDQTKTISRNVKPNPNKKRKLGQIPLRDRQAQRQQPPQVKKAFAQRKTKSQGIEKASTTAKPKVRKAFAQRNKSKKDIEEIFDFGNQTEFF